jgi:hypothetical protein
VCDAPNDGQVLRRIIFSGSGAIFFEDDVEFSVKLVFDAPVLAEYLQGFLRREAPIRYHVAGSRRCFAICAGSTCLDPDHAGKTRPIFTGKMVRIEHAGAACFGSAVFSIGGLEHR